MALVIGNKSVANAVPSASSYTLSHTQDVGADGYLLVSVVMANTVLHTGCTYDGVAMTEILNIEGTGLSQTWAVYGIETTTTTAKDIVASFDGNQWNNISIYACSFTGSGGVGVALSNGATTTPHTESITVSENSIVYAFGIAVNAFTGIEIDGSARPAEFTHNTNKQVRGGLSLTGLTAGSIDVITQVTTSTVSNTRVEITEATADNGAQGSFMFIL
jgi:hypothetical protein